MPEVKIEQEGRWIAGGLTLHYGQRATLWPWTSLFSFLSIFAWSDKYFQFTDRWQHLVLFIYFFISHDFVGLSRTAAGDHPVQLGKFTGCSQEIWMSSAGCFCSIPWNRKMNLSLIRSAKWKRDSLKDNVAGWSWQKTRTKLM